MASHSDFPSDSDAYVSDSALQLQVFDEFSGHNGEQVTAYQYGYPNVSPLDGGGGEG